jgi:hypothetical protein
MRIHVHKCTCVHTHTRTHSSHTSPQKCSFNPLYAPPPFRAGCAAAIKDQFKPSSPLPLSLLSFPAPRGTPPSSYPSSYPFPGAAADMYTEPAGALAIGTFAGLVSVAGYYYLTPLLQRRIGLLDTCGIHNLHGMPGIIGAVASAIVARVRVCWACWASTASTACRACCASAVSTACRACRTCRACWACTACTVYRVRWAGFACSGRAKRARCTHTGLGVADRGWVC